MNVYIKSTDSFSGLFAMNAFNKDAVVVDLSCGDLTSERTKYSIQIDEDLHSDHPAGRFMNHSETPNCRVVGYLILANRDIAPDEELTFDYLSTETEISHPFIDRETGKPIGQTKVAS